MLNIGFASHELPQYNRLNQLVDALLAAPRNRQIPQAGTISWTGPTTAIWIPREISNMTSTSSMAGALTTAGGRTGGWRRFKRGAAHYVIREWAVDYRRLSQVDSLQIGIGRMFRQAVYR